MSFSDTANAKKYASIAETAAAQAKLYAGELENAPDYAEQAAASATAAAASAQTAASIEVVVNNLAVSASESATEAAASAAEAGNAAAASVGQCLRVPVGELVDILPASPDRINKFLTFDSSGSVLLLPESDVAILDSEGKVPVSMIPAIALSEIFVVNSQAEMLALNVQEGDIAKRTDLGYSFILAAEPASVLSNWVQLNDDVLSQLGMSTGATQIGAVDSIGNPTTVQAAIDAKLSPSTLAAATGANLVGYGTATVKDFLDGIGAKYGYSYLGELQSVSEFNGMTSFSGKSVSLKGWYSGSNIGGGLFIFNSSIPKSKHDGGKYISPTVPYSTPASFVSGTGETDPLGSGVWVRRGVTDELRSEWYGMSTGMDVTSILSKLSATAGIDSHGITISPGNYILSGTVTVNMDSSASGNVQFFRGAGKRGTVFTVDVTKTTGSTLVFVGSIGTPQERSDGLILTGIKIRGNGVLADGTRWTGTGFYIQNMHGFYLRDVQSENLNRTVIIQNSLYGYIESSRFNQGGEGILMRRNGLTTGANAVQFTRCDFADHTQFCVHAIESHSIKFQTCTFEANGGKLDKDGVVIPGTACVQTETSGASGGVVAVYDNCYFEANKIADIIHLVNINRNQIVDVRDCTFNKGGTGYSNARILMVNQLTTMTTKATLCLDKNRFLSVSGTDADTFNDIAINNFQLLGYGRAELLDYNNIFSAVTPIARDSYVVWKKSPDDGFICRGLSAGGFTSSASRNIVSSTRQSVGVYRVVTNQLTTMMTFQVQLDNLGFANISTAENNETFTISTFNGSGVAADVNFRVLSKAV